MRKVKHERWLRDEWQMLAQMDLAIIRSLEAGYVEDALQGAFSGRRHYTKVFEQFVNMHMPSRYDLNTRLRDWIVKELEAVDTWLNSRTDPITAGEYETQLKTLPPNYLKVIPDRMWVDLAESFGQIHGLLTLHRQLILGIKAEWPSEVLMEFPTIEEVTEKLQEMVGSTEGAKPRCTACCPHCGMMCIKENFHAGDHLSIHQPSGLNGDPRHGGSNHGCCEPLSCVDARREGFLVSNDGYKTTFKCDPEGWRQCFPGWECPDAGVLPAQKSVLYELRKYLFVTYQDQIAEHFRLKPWPHEQMPSTKSLAEIKGQLLAIVG